MLAKLLGQPGNQLRVPVWRAAGFRFLLLDSMSPCQGSPQCRTDLRRRSLLQCPSQGCSNEMRPQQKFKRFWQLAFCVQAATGSASPAITLSCPALSQVPAASVRSWVVLHDYPRTLKMHPAYLWVLGRLGRTYELKDVFTLSLQ